MHTHGKKIRRSILAAALCFVLWLNALPLWAAEIHGQVKFGGLPVPGATVTASQGDRNFVAVTDPMGNYSIPDLADGVWNFKVEMLAFEPLTREVTIAPGATPGAPASDFDLKMLSLDAIKAIAPPAPPTPAISSTAPVVSPNAATTNTAIPTPPSGKKQAANKNAPAAPANGQAGFQRTDLNASTAAPASNAATAPPANSAFNGQDTAELSQRATDGFVVNGSENNGNASPFAQAGRFGNNIRGPNSLYQFMVGFVINNSSLDARTFSLTGQNTPKPNTNLMTALGNFAGPIRIGHIFKAPPTIFLNYQFTRNTVGNNSPALMPTAAEREGDFSASPNLIYQPNGSPYPGNMIPASVLAANPQAQALLKFYPLPNFTTGASYNYQIPIVSLTQSNNVQARINKSLSNKDQMFGQFGYQYVTSNNPNIFGFIDTGATQGINLQVSEQHRFTPRTFGNLTVNFNRNSTRTNPYFENKQNVSGDAGITGNNQQPMNYGPPGLGFSSGISGLSDSNAAFNRSQTIGVSDSMTWIHGRHNVQYGGDFRWQQFNYLSQTNPRGSFNFTGADTSLFVNATTGAPCARGTSAASLTGCISQPGTGVDFADFLLGVPDSSQIAFGNADKYLRAKMADAFVNDDWRVGPSLTLSIGLRYDYGSPITETQGRLVNLDIAPGYTAIAPVLGSDPVGSLTGQHYSPSLIHPDRHEFEPITALAWRPIPASSIVVRAGYSLRYNTSAYQQIAQQMYQQTPLSTSLSAPNVFTTTPLNTLASGFNSLPGISTDTFAIDPNFRVGYAQNWNASIQRDLPGSLVMTLNYAGTKGTRNQQEFYPQTYPVGVTSPCPTCPTGYIYETSNGNSHREAGWVQLRRRLHSGLTATAQYTYAKAIDDATTGGRGQGSSVVAQNWLDLSAERGLSSFDQRQLLNFTMNYTTGQGIAGGTLLSGWRGAIYKEWTIITSVNAGTGLPLTPFYQTVVPGTGFTGIRPDYTGLPVTVSSGNGLFLNSLAYTAPVGTWGNAGRDSITGPDQFSFNASFQRTFRLKDRYSLDARIDATNPINHVTFSSYNTTINSPQFGTAAGPNGMRSLQTTLRLRF